MRAIVTLGTGTNNERWPLITSVQCISIFYSVGSLKSILLSISFKLSFVHFSVAMGSYEVLENVHFQDLWDMTHQENSLFRGKGSYSDSYPF